MRHLVRGDTGRDREAVAVAVPSKDRCNALVVGIGRNAPGMSSGGNRFPFFRMGQIIEDLVCEFPARGKTLNFLAFHEQLVNFVGPLMEHEAATSGDFVGASSSFIFR